MCYLHQSDGGVAAESAECSQGFRPGVGKALRDRCGVQFPLMGYGLGEEGQVVGADRTEAIEAGLERGAEAGRAVWFQPRELSCPGHCLVQRERRAPMCSARSGPARTCLASSIRAAQAMESAGGVSSARARWVTFVFRAARRRSRWSTSVSMASRFAACGKSSPAAGHVPQISSMAARRSVTCLAALTARCGSAGTVASSSSTCCRCRASEEGPMVGLMWRSSRWPQSGGGWLMWSWSSMRLRHWAGWGLGTS